MSKSRGKKRKRINDRALYRKLRKKMTQKGLAKDWQVVYDPEGEVKMSEVILDFVAPYMAELETDEESRKLIGVAVIAWNIALLPEEERAVAVDKLLDQATFASISSDLKPFIYELVERKNTYFADIERFILNYQTVDTGEGMHLTIASTLTKI